MKFCISMEKRKKKSLILFSGKKATAAGPLPVAKKDEGKTAGGGRTRITEGCKS